jgi:XRE family aerobic/anaerobic benzoate catabolism transcriptional regulator
MAKRRKIQPKNAATEDASAFLTSLGERVRTMRSRRAMSRKMLARHARVSERYLAQLEAGKGNFSIALLRRVAKAIGAPVAELIDDRPERPVEAVLLDQFLDRLSPSQLNEARTLLLARFGGSSGERRRNRIALIGLRGGGKSTLGRMLAARTGLPFIELDREIEALSGMSLSELFEMFGQDTYRRTERAAVEALLQKHPSFVVATGGSLVTEPGTYELLLASCLTVWVRAAPDEHMQRVIDQGDLRPMADNARAMDDLLAILKSREPLYTKADIVLDTAGKAPEQSLAELLKVTGFARGEPVPQFA